MFVVIMGVSGVGKTTTGRLLAARLGWPFFDADDYHSEPNVRKMTRGEPLDDADRASWLRALHQVALDTSQTARDGVLACSALKQAYRDVIAGDLEDVRFVLLDAPRNAILERMTSRDHFMSPTLLQSQLDALEHAEDILVIDATLDSEEMVDDIARAIRGAEGTA